MNACAYLLAAASALLIASGVQAQDSRPPLAGGDQVGGIRTPVYRTDITDLSRGRVADGFTFAAGGDLVGPYNPLMQLGDPDIILMVKLLHFSDVGFAYLEASGFDLPGPPG